MKRFFTSLTTFSLVEAIGRHPAIAGGILTLLGVGGGATAIAILTSPTITPFVSSNFNPNQSIGTTSNGLKPNGGTSGAMQLPSPTATNSATYYFELAVNPNLAYAQALEVPFLGANLISNTVPGQPNFTFQRSFAGQQGSQWWLNPGPTAATGGSVGGGMSNYANGLYPFSATGGGCARPPTGVWQGGTASVQWVDPGFGCPATATVNLATIPNAGAQQATGAGSTATTCAVVNGEAVVTAHVSVAHGLTPGLTYSMQGFTPTGYNSTTYTALLGTTGTTLVGTTGATSCPTSVTTEGTALSGTGGSISPPAISPTGPWTGITGVTLKSGQHVCGWLVENGDDTAFPGSQSLEIVDDKGNAVPGSPALVPYLNQGTASQIGYTVTGAQSPSTPALNVTALNTYTGSGSWASYNSSTGQVTFSLSTNPSFVAGSEFTVAGMTPSGFNQTYVASAVSGSGPFVVLGNPLTGPVGTPQANNPGASTGSGGSLASVIMPGQTILGATPGQTYVLPYGTFGGTGTGGVGTYALSNNQTTAIGSIGAPVTIFGFSSFYYVAAANGSLPAGASVAHILASSIGDFTTLIGGSNTALTGSAKTGWGGAIGNFATLWGALPSQSGGAPSTADLASICTKQTDIQTYALTHNIKVNSLYRLNDPGIWGDSSNATINGYITNSDGAHATLNVLSTPYGSLALAIGTETAKLTGVGLPVASPVTIPLTTTATSTYAITPNTTAVLGSIGSPVTFAVGAFAPALPVQSNTVKGYIDTTGGVSTLHVTSLDDGVSHSGLVTFTGTLGTNLTGRIDDGGTANVNPVNVLTVTSPGGAPPANAVIGVGTRVCPPVGTPGAFTCANVTALGTGAGYSGTYTLDGSAQNVTSQLMFGSGKIPGPATNLQTSGAVGSFQVGMAVTDGAGASNLTGPPLLITGIGANGLTIAGNYYPPLVGAMIGTLTTLVPGEYIQNSTASPAIVNPVKVVTYSGACGISGAYNGGPGCYTLSGSPNSTNAVASSGSPATFFGTTITDGGAIAPGPALTIRDQGPFVTFPLTSIGAKTGTIALSGEYDTGTLGGTPSGIQVLVSNSANGPPLAGCTPCNWGALTGTISGGKWSGTLGPIPGGGPYFVSVRAANGIAYATLPNSVKVGWIFALWGQGQADSIQGAQSGTYTSWFSGLWGFGGWSGAFGGNEHYLQGPPVTANFVPGQAVGNAGDRFGVGGAGAPLSEAVSAFDQELSNAFGVPASFLSATRDGVGIGLATLGNVTQTQTVGVGDGSTLTWCSASKFCGHVDVGFPLVFNAASLTGGWFSGSISGSTLTATTRIGGALEPGMVLNVTGSPTLLNCLSNCTSINFSTSTWALSSSAASGVTGAMRADAPASLLPFGATTTPWPNLNIQQNGSAAYAFSGFGTQLVKAGTFKITDTDPATGIPTTICQDSQVFAYNNTGGNCTGANVASSFVNYQTGDYQITFASGHAPLSGHAITAIWTNIISPDAFATSNRPQGLDFFGDGTPQSGADSALFAKAPGGINGHIYSGEGTDKQYMFNSLGPTNVGYQYGGLGYSQMISWLYGVKFPALIPGASPTVSFITTGQWRVEGPQAFIAPTDFLDGVHDQWTQDVATQSLFTGHTTAATSKLTLDADTAYPMWEGEILGCVTLSTNCNIGPYSGNYITGLATGAWGKSGSTYTLGGTVIDTAASQAMQNPVYYSGPGGALYAGTLNDILVQNQGLAGTTGRNPHTAAGFTGGRRATSRWAAMIYGNAPGNATPATDPKVDRVEADAVGCDAAALAAPCLDVGTTYQATFSTATWAGNTVTITGGLTAHARPFVVGQAFACSGCNSNLVITSLSVPPTESTATGAGEVGQTFTFTVQNAAGQAIGGSGGGTVTAGCSGTSGTGSNCIDVAISLNVSGTFGTAAAIDTCGANNINGNAPNYVVPNGKCQGNGIGEIVRTFRIGTNQAMYGAAAQPPTAGSVFDDGVDIGLGFFTQSSAFTCNIVAAKVVQCVKGAAYTAGVPSLGQWSSGSTYISYGDLTIVSGRIASLLGYVGGQSFPFTPGNGYTNGVYPGIAATCTIQSGGTAPRFDVTVAGGAIVDVVPSAATSGNVPAGLGVGSTCTVPLTTVTCPGGSCGGAIATIPLAPTEGFGGIATYNTDSNTMGTFLYDNSGEPGNPLNSFFTNGTAGYFEPGLPLRPFGLFQGAAVSG